MTLSVTNAKRAVRELGITVAAILISVSYSAAQSQSNAVHNAQFLSAGIYSGVVGNDKLLAAVN
jgi:hypothetical protein